MLHFALASVLATSTTSVWIHELRTDQVGSDLSEYIELRGAPGASLDGLSYLVLGDGLGKSGSIEALVSLDGHSIPADGYFVIAESTFNKANLGDVVDLVTGLNFEDADNVSHFLVSGFSGAVGDDLDTNDDGVLDVTPWSGVLDSLALVKELNPPSTTEYHYGACALGPLDGEVPAHVYRSGAHGVGLGAWSLGARQIGALDTPGAGNEVGRIQVSSGGQQLYVMEAGAAHAGQLYFLLGSLSGTSPGMSIDGVTIPLQLDPYFLWTLREPSSPLNDSIGALDVDGGAQAEFRLPAGGLAALAGLHMDHAFVVLHTTSKKVVYASEPVGLDFTP